MTAPTPWNSSTAYNAGDIVQASTDQGSGFYFKCSTAGVSGSAEPFWPTVIDATVQDNTVTWTAVSIVAGDFQQPNPSAIIELYELELFADKHGANDIFRFHAGTKLTDNTDIVWRGNTYLRFPVEADGFDYSGNGPLPRPKIRVSNVLSTITALLLTLPNGLEGAKVTRVRTLVKYLDAVNFDAGGTPLLTEDGDFLLHEDGDKILEEVIIPTEDFSAEFPREIYYVDRKTAENREVVEFELVSSFDLASVRAPKRQCIGNICQWRYRSVECGYTGSSYYDAFDRPVSSQTEDVCGKRLTSCILRFGENAELPFGSFPGIGKTTV